MYPPNPSHHPSSRYIELTQKWEQHGIIIHVHVPWNGVSMIHWIVIVIGNTHLDCYHGNKAPPHHQKRKASSLYLLILLLCAICYDKLEKKQKLQVLPNFPQKYGYHGNHVSTHSKNNRRLCFTIIDLHAKFEDDRRRNAASRALTRQSLLFPQKLLLPWQRCLRPHQNQ